MALIFQKSGQILRLRSFTEDTWYPVNLTLRECECYAFKSSSIKLCKHLEALGIYPITKDYTPLLHPGFTTALAAFVKSIRLRNIEEAVYWLCYLDAFHKEPEHRFRTARRLLIGAAEDGLSISVMEKVSEHFKQLLDPKTSLISFVAEALRICKVASWWAPATGGGDYIHASLVGSRWYLYAKKYTLEELQTNLAQAIKSQHSEMAIGSVLEMADSKKLKDAWTATQQAEYLLHTYITEHKSVTSFAHIDAARLLKIHLMHAKALSHDRNYIAQAAWLLAGGKNHAAELITPVFKGECTALIDQATEAWKIPHPVPDWAGDGVLSPGSDQRFLGRLPNMMACVNARKHYGRLSPADAWLPDFQCYDGLQVEWVQK